ncbi:hypothetical protein ABEX25_19320 [Paenibacillus thiaminolyticus]|uniref:hypothetical protein n=1 Tax=Paenibacillus thiaminolyticus TaxID=49283 RepID=UPI003D2A1C72
MSMSWHALLTAYRGTHFTLAADHVAHFALAAITAAFALAAYRSTLSHWQPIAAHTEGQNKKSAPFPGRPVA